MSAETRIMPEPEPDQLSRYDCFVDRRTQSDNPIDKITLRQGVAVFVPIPSFSKPIEVPIEESFSAK